MRRGLASTGMVCDLCRAAKDALPTRGSEGVGEWDERCEESDSERCSSSSGDIAREQVGGCTHTRPDVGGARVQIWWISTSTKLAAASFGGLVRLAELAFPLDWPDRKSVV